MAVSRVGSVSMESAGREEWDRTREALASLSLAQSLAGRVARTATGRAMLEPLEFEGVELDPSVLQARARYRALAERADHSVWMALARTGVLGIPAGQKRDRKSQAVVERKAVEQSEPVAAAVPRTRERRCLTHGYAECVFCGWDKGPWGLRSRDSDRAAVPSAAEPPQDETPHRPAK